MPCFHIGTGGEVKLSRGPGGAIINYVETNFPGQRVVAHLVASGALDRHPGCSSSSPRAAPHRVGTGAG